ncbi:MAG: alpha/beta fold hydrolase [Nannocystaceae bacterium]
MKLDSLLGALFVSLMLLTGCAHEVSTRTYKADTEVAFVEANGLRFAYLAAGDPADPLILLMHGFPDTPHAWDGMREALAKPGYYVVSPYLRGYAPSEIPSEDAFDSQTLGRDVLGLIAAFGKQDADIVGHDWGAMSVYAAAALEPKRIRRMVALVIPHPATLKIRLRDLRRARHFTALRRRRAAKRFARDDLGGVDELYARWSPTWKFEASQLEDVKNSFTAEGSLDAALGYYRVLKFKTPAFLKVKTQVPALVIAGLDDGTTPLDAFDNSSGFAAPMRLEKLPTGHFPHRERPDLVLPLLLEFLAPQGTATTPP